MKMVECVPNFSEGRRPDVVQSIRDAIASASGVILLDISSDASHNRSVITFAAPVDRVVDAAFAGIRVARDLIDLTHHRGEHPRMGAADVVPFIPLEETTMEECIALARQLGERVARELAIPVYLYERAATRPERENLADVRRGGFEGIRDEIGRVADRAPDFGEARVHPTAGAVAIGARPFLVAYNVYLGDASHLDIAKRVAKKVRGSSGGLPFVKGLGLAVDGQAQVSMNLVDVARTPMHRAFDLVRREAEAEGVATTWSEIVGLVPERALLDAAAHYLQLVKFTPEQLLERRLHAARNSGVSLSDFVASVASSEPTPGGGSVAAHAGALAAALAQMVAGLTIGRKKYAAVEEEMSQLSERAARLVGSLSSLVERDARAYGAVSAAYKLPKEPEAARAQAIADALIGASEVPLETARACADVAEIAEVVARRGNSNALSDAGVSALLAEAACRAAAYNVRINVVGLPDRSAGAPLVREAEQLVARTREHTRAVTALVEAAL
ncbi:MAG: glutamate formimidoyltransferase [Gemmatimonadota bacterium]|nr:glutamate formimidoyltransferase [Gemmatimonadota bacterium]